MPLFLHDDGPDLAEGHAHLLGHLIGIEWRDSRHIKRHPRRPEADQQPRLPRRRATLSPHQRAATTAPVVLQLEDLHWADNESLDFLNYLAEVNRDVPLLILASTRPTLFERRTDWSSTEGVHQRIDLHRVGQERQPHAGQRTAQEASRDSRGPAANCITGGAEGNPFYMEELVQACSSTRARSAPA